MAVDPALLMSLLAARVERGPAALQELMQSSPGGQALDPQDLLARLGQDNPTAAALLQMFATQRAAAAPPREIIEGSAVDVTDEEIEGLRVELTARAEETRRLQIELRRAQAELAQLRERSDLLAEALGACALCWGQDPSCRACRGHGLPGKSIPDATLFYEYVLPAVLLVRASRQRATVMTPPTPGSGRPSGADSTPLRNSN
jgi:hypothetical protein